MDADEDLKFPCSCGNLLEVPAEMAGSTLVCPYCDAETAVPGPAGAAAPPVASDPEAASPDPARCPQCASPSSGERCPVCDVELAPAGSFPVLSECREQDLIPPPLADWILRKFHWIRQRGAAGEFARHRLVLPTTDFFPTAWEPTAEKVDQVLRLMQGYAALGEFDVQWEIFDAVPTPQEHLITALSSNLSGCFFAPLQKGDSYWIVLDPDLFSDRLRLVATLGHELGHLFVHVRLGLAKLLPPDHEPMTDLASVFLGFGVLNCESSFRFLTWSDGNREGWSATKSGYLSQAELSFALALYCSLRPETARDVPAHLTGSAPAYWKQGMAFFKKQPDLLRRLEAGTLFQA